MEATKVLCEAYEKLFGRCSDLTMNIWQIAAMVMEGLDMRILGRDLTRKCLFAVCNHLGEPISNYEKDIYEVAIHNGREYFWRHIPFEVLPSQMLALEEMEVGS